MAANKQGEMVWTKNLCVLPNFSTEQIEKPVQGCGKKEIGSKGYKFFSENFIHDAYVGFKRSEGSLAENGICTISIKARCFRSQRKNEEPHNLMLKCKADNRGSATVIATLCSCKAW